MTTFAIEAFRGDTIDLTATVTRDGGPVDLTGLSGAALTFTAKRKVKDADDDAVVQKTIGAGITVTDAEAGELLVTILPEDTDGLTKAATLVCDLQLVEADGTVTTVASGTLAIEPDVTRTAS